MRVLVVDDNPDFRLLATRAFESSGHQVEAQPSAFGLVNRVAGVQGPAPDVVVLDCDLPGLSGPAVLELLARDRRTQQVPVVLTSAAATEVLLAAASLHGRATFIAKDGHFRALVSRVQEHAAAHALAVVTQSG